MSKAYIDESSLTSIGDAIRSVNGSSSLYTPAQMANEILALTNGGLVYRGTVASQSDLPSDPSDGDLYIVGNQTMFWSDTDNEWKTISVQSAGGISTVKVNGTPLVEDSQGAVDVVIPSWSMQQSKPSYTASEVGAVATTSVGAARGVASLGSDGKVPSSQLPSSSQIEFATQSEAEAGTDNTKVMTPLRVAQEIAVKSPSANYTLLTNRPAMVQGVGTDATRENGASAASGDYSHAEGRFTIASGECSHAEGSSNTASGYASHAEGNTTTAIGQRSHSEGYGTVAVSSNDCPQHVEGMFNAIDTANGQSDGTPLARYAHIIGNGTGTQNRSNLYAVRWNGVIEVNNVDMVDNVTIKRKNGTKQLYVDFGEVEAYIASVESRFRSTLESIAQQLESQGIDIDIGGGADVVGEYLVIDGLEIGQDGYIAVDAPISDGYLEF